MVVSLMAVLTSGCGRMPAASDIDCERNKLANMPELVDEGRVVEDSAVFDSARDDMSLSALVLHILVWQARDGSTLRASAGGLCDRVMKFERSRR